MNESVFKIFEVSMTSLKETLDNYKSPVLIFTMKLTGDRTLESGRLALCDYSRGQSIDFLWRATSGNTGKQSIDDVDKVGRGAIPAPYAAGLKSYYVNTKYAISAEKGIEGRYFFIEPEEIMINGVQRSMMRIHYDANVPGSAGCIVISNKKAFDYFVLIMDTLKAKHSKIPLWVIYSFD